MQHTIRISSAIITNDRGELLVVRKKGSRYYMLPGGKIDHQEELIDALLRELHEELGLQFKNHDFKFLGKHCSMAVNEENTIVEGHIFCLTTSLHDTIEVQAEIEDAIWLTKESYVTYQLAHLLQEFAIPRWLSGHSGKGEHDIPL